MIRGSLNPGNAVSWTFSTAGDEEKTAILIPNATPQSLTVVAYNLSDKPVVATMTGWDIDPGKWATSRATYQGANSEPDKIINRDVELERSKSIILTFAPKVTTIITLTLVEKGIPYWQRPDLGISVEDVNLHGRTISVTVHSLGALASPPTTLALFDANGRLIAKAPVPALEAPADLRPRTVTIILPTPEFNGATLVLDPDSKLNEITRVNNRVPLQLTNATTNH